MPNQGGDPIWWHMHPAVANLKTTDVHVVVTGGGGWLGQAALAQLDGVYGDEIQRRVSVFGSSAKTLTLASGRQIASRPFAEIAKFGHPAPIILHFAYLTRGYAAQMPLAAYLATNRAMSEAVADLAARCGARGLFVPSSGAVYGQGGGLDADLARNPYGALKLEDERRFADLAARGGFPSVIFRIFNLAGPFMNHVSHYALGSILGDIAAGRPIEIRAAHPVVRAYTHVGDVIALALALLLRGETVGPIDTGGEVAVEIGELARRATHLLGRADLDILRPDFAAGAPDIYVGDGARYAELAASVGLNLRGLDEQIIDTAAFLGQPIA